MGSVGPTQHMSFCHDPTARITFDESDRSLKRSSSGLGTTRESTRVHRVDSTGFLFQAMCDASPSCCRCQLRQPSTSTPPLHVATSLSCRFRRLLFSRSFSSLLLPSLLRRVSSFSPLLPSLVLSSHHKVRMPLSPGNFGICYHKTVLTANFMCLLDDVPNEMTIFCYSYIC